MIRLPWWGSVIIAALGYIALKYGAVQLLEPENRLSGLLPQFAPVFAMGFLLLAAKQLYDDPDKGDDDQEQNEDRDEQDNG